MKRKMIVALFVMSAWVVSASMNEANAQLTSEEQQVVALVNQARAQRGLPQLAVSGGLTHSSRNWSATMNSQHRMHHSGMGGRSENVAMGYNDGAAVFRAWMNSPGHYANMMSRNCSTIGVGQSGNCWTLQTSGGGVAPAVHRTTTASPVQQVIYYYPNQR